MVQHLARKPVGALAGSVIEQHAIGLERRSARQQSEVGFDRLGDAFSSNAASSTLERAVLLANENAAAMGVTDRYAAVTPDMVPADVEFDEIWSNPPIRIGKEALHELLLTWLPRLAPGGRMVTVVGKFLGADSLQRWLGEQGWPTERLASSKGFRVLETRRA